MADDSFVGHCDEVILTLKSAAYSPSASGANQKLKIFMCQFAQQAMSASQTLNKAKSLKISYDHNLDMSQQDQLMN